MLTGLNASLTDQVAPGREKWVFPGDNL